MSKMIFLRVNVQSSYHPPAQYLFFFFGGWGESQAFAKSFILRHRRPSVFCHLTSREFKVLTGKRNNSYCFNTVSQSQKSNVLILKLPDPSKTALKTLMSKFSKHLSKTSWISLHFLVLTTIV